MRIIIECPERILHLEAGYIYADRPSSTSTLLQSGGGPYIFANFIIARLVLLDKKAAVHLSVQRLGEKRSEKPS